MALDRDEVLRTYDDTIRRVAQIAVPEWTIGWSSGGRVLRAEGPTRGRLAAFLGYTDLGGLDDAAVDAIIAAEVGHFAELGGHSEWKLYGHDQPADLGDRLAAAGLVAEDLEALVVGGTDEVAAAVAGVTPAPGVVIRRADGAADYAGIGQLHGTVWGEDDAWLGDELAQEQAARPDLIDVFVADADGVIVSAGWIRYADDGAPFAGLWGGSTLLEWRRKGIYRSLVDVRARCAAERGVPYLQVDASPDSEPILARLGLEKLTWTRPYTWPAPADSEGDSA